MTVKLHREVTVPRPLSRKITVVISAKQPLTLSAETRGSRGRSAPSQQPAGGHDPKGRLSDKGDAGPACWKPRAVGPRSRPKLFTPLETGGTWALAH